MRPLKTAAILLALAGGAWAGDFDALVKTLRASWPERNTLVVVCDKNASSMTLMDLGSATENTMNLLVVHLQAGGDLEKTLGLLRRRKEGELVLLLLPDDPVTGEKGPATKALVARMGMRKIPSVAISEGGLKLGAVLAQGAGTGDKVRVNKEAAAKIGVSLPPAE